VLPPPLSFISKLTGSKEGILVLRGLNLELVPSTWIRAPQREKETFNLPLDK
jgi:hypothetical protein